MEIGGLYFQKRVCEVQDIIEFVAQKKLRILHKHKDTKLLSVSSKWYQNRIKKEFIEIKKEFAESWKEKIVSLFG